MATATSPSSAARPARAKPQPAVRANPAKAAARRPAEGVHEATGDVAAPPVPSGAQAATAATKAVDASNGKGKQRLVRDSFTIPKHEYAVLSLLKQRAVRLQHPAKKSELLRAGIAALQAMPDAALLAALRAVPTLKTGRPKDSGKR